MLIILLFNKQLVIANIRFTVYITLRSQVGEDGVMQHFENTVSTLCFFLKENKS